MSTTQERSHKTEGGDALSASNSTQLLAVNPLGLERALIIDSFWIELILSGLKIWEMRTDMTNVRGRIGLIKKGSGLVVGEAELTDSLPPLPACDYFHYTPLHRITKRDDVAHKWRYPWVLKNAKRYDSPIPYSHPQGAVVWVRLDR
jgi:hypothetical protein